LNFLFVQNAYAHLPDFGELFAYPFLGSVVGSIVGALLTKQTYVSAIVGAFIGHIITTIAMGLILNIHGYGFTEVVLLFGMIPALIVGIIVGFIVNFVRKHPG